MGKDYTPIPMQRQRYEEKGIKWEEKCRDREEGRRKYKEGRLYDVY